MAKKKDTTSLIWNGAIILFGLLMFLPMFLSLVNVTVPIVGTTGTPLFQLAENFTTDATKAIALASMIFTCIAVFGGLLLAVVALLNMLNIKLPSIITKVLGALVLISTIIAFILLIVLANKATTTVAGTNVSTGALAVGAYLLLIFGLLQGICTFARK